jgi:hypothetical protein
MLRDGCLCREMGAYAERWVAKPERVAKKEIGA